MKRFVLIPMILGALTLSATTYYVDNVNGNDSNDGSQQHPVASIEKGISLLNNSDRLEVAPNGGKPYVRPYPGADGNSLNVRKDGTPEAPLVINGNGAVLSGLAVIPSDRWKAEEDGIYGIEFWPRSNMYRRYKQQDYWIPESRIFFVDGQHAPNCKSLDELRHTPGGFWWSRGKKTLYFLPPTGKKIEDLKIEFPANNGFYIFGSHVRIENFTFILSWNDGFDTNRTSKASSYRNCVAIDNCGQGFSCHDQAHALYEDCVAIRCASAGSCDIHDTNTTYARCVFMNNFFEAGVSSHGNSVHSYHDCLIIHNIPFEQVWVQQCSSMLFKNCLIVGNGDSTPLIYAQHGIVSFQRCTLLNAGMLNRYGKGSRGTLNLENCLLGNMETALINIPAGTEERFLLAGNVYFGNKGFCLADKELPAGTLLDFDLNSVWKEVNTSNPLKPTLPEPIRLKNRHGETDKIGAELPASVWKNYQKYLNVQTSPEGVTFAK